MSNSLIIKEVFFNVLLAQDKTYLLNIIGSEVFWTEDIEKAMHLEDNFDILDIEDLRGYKKNTFLIRIKSQFSYEPNKFVIPSYKKFQDLKSYFLYFSKKKGFIKPHHIMVYNILKNKSVYNGFSKGILTKNKNKDPLKTISNALKVLKKIEEKHVQYEINKIFGFSLTQKDFKKIKERFENEIYKS